MQEPKTALTFEAFLVEATEKAQRGKNILVEQPEFEPPA